MMKPTVIALLLSLCASAGWAQEALSEDQRILHALSRLTFGVRSGDLTRVRNLGLDKWIDQQLDPAAIPQEGFEARINKVYPGFGLAAKAREKLQEQMEDEMKMTARQQRQDAVRELRDVITERAIFSERQLDEVLADFWRNHFNVDVAKGSVRDTGTNYELAVIRQGLHGRFDEMLMNSAKHPAMLVYLDNYLSRKPPSKQELRRIERRVRRKTDSKERARAAVELALQRGLNENYARELMELHTLGVDNGYSQRDVEEVARAFTGWTIDRGELLFAYRDDMHDRGQKVVLGKALPLGRRESGIIEGETIIKRLSRHKNTARFIAWKLCRRLVADEPSDEIVDHAAEVFLKSKGHLPAVVKAIVTHPRFYDVQNFQAKFKTPFEFVISALRVTGAEVSNPQSVWRRVHELGLEIYSCEDPTGWSDATADWRDPGVMALRWKFAMDLVDERISGVRIPTAFYYDLPSNLLKLAEALSEKVCPVGLGKDTKRVLERVLFREVQKAGSLDKVDRKKLARLLTGILIGCPEFQQQ